MSTDAPTILLAGGGSGGHIYPGLAIAERIVELKPDARPLFVCSERSIDQEILTRAGADFRTIPAQPWSARPRSFARFARAYPRCRRTVRGLIAERGVDRVVAMGGFVAAPVVVEARRSGVPTTLVNLDAPPGKANRWIAPRCDDVVSATPLPMLPRFARCITGMPIRRQAIGNDTPDACRNALGLATGASTLLVVGGSQGAQSLNDLMAIFAAQPDRPLAGWQVLHLCGADPQTLQHVYDDARIRAVVLPFTERMDLAWGAADLAISRAGASSVAEAAGNRIPTLFLPYPFHRDQHQRLNAAPLVESGGAVLCPDLVDARANLGNAGAALRMLLAGADHRAAMRQALIEHPQPDAADALARRVLADL